VLFPLPVTPFEYYYLCDDRPAYPTVFPVKLTLAGELDRPLLERALGLVVERHPLLGARVDRTGRWPQWVMAQPPQLEERPAPIASDACIAVEQRTFRVWQQMDGGATTLRFLFHHACVDGVAGLQVAEDLLVAYDHLATCGTNSIRWRSLDHARLRKRAEYGLAGYKPKPIDLVNVGRTWLPLLLQRSDVVHTKHNEPLPVTCCFPFHYAEHWLSADESLQLAQQSRHAGVTINDLLLRDLFLVLRAWNEDQRHRVRRIRILMPTNLRQPEDQDMPAANVLSFAFLKRSAAELANEHQLLRSIRDETAAIKRWRLGLYFVGGLGVGSAIPRLVPGLLRRSWPFATAVFTNLGPVFAHAPLRTDRGQMIAGHAVLQSVSGTAPLRPLTRVAVIALSYAGRLGLFAYCDPKWFSHSQQQSFLELFVAQVKRTLVGDLHG
jgi:hypothetical protein